MRAFLVLVLGLAAGGPAVAADPPPEGGDHPAVARDRHRPEKVTVSGTVTDAQGRAVAGADVFVFGDQRQNCSFPRVPCLELGRGVTDREGAFRFESGTMADTSHQFCVVAPGHGATFVEFDADRKAADLGTVALPAERPVRGKVVGPDGKAAGGVTIEVRGLVMDGYKVRWFGSPRPGETPRPLTAKSAADGTFELRGLPGDAIETWVRIDDERFALYERNPLIGLRQQQGIIPLKDGQGRAVEIKLDAPVYVSGVVTREDTGAPLAKAWVGVTFADIEVPADSHVAAIWARTDDRGRYRVRCGPWASRVHVYAFAPPGTPCPDWSAGPIEVPAGQAEIDLPVTMPVGILVKGKIVETGTGKPVANAGYVHILRREKPRTMDKAAASRAYWANEYHYRYSAADGTFELPVFAGESGVILVKAPDSSFASRVTSCGDILFGKAGPWWSVVEGLAELDTKPGDKGLSLDIPLTRGVTATGTLSGPNGEPVPRAVVFASTPLHAHHQQLFSGDEWAAPARDGAFALPGRDPTATTELYFLDVEHQWGATVRFDPKTQAGKPLKVALQPCGWAKVRFLDPDEKPVREDGIALNGFHTALVLGFRASAPDPRAMVHPADWYFGQQAFYFDPKRYEKLTPDKDGSVVYPSLIPGAPYKWVTANPKGFPALPVPADVAVRSGETTDLGTVTVQPLNSPPPPPGAPDAPPAQAAAPAPPADGPSSTRGGTALAVGIGLAVALGGSVVVVLFLKNRVGGR